MSNLGINEWNLIVQGIAFLIFIWLIWRYAFGPITRMLDQRQERIRDSMEAAQKMQAELQATAAKNEETLVEARQEAQKILGQAREAADATMARARDEAGKQSDEYLQRAQANLRSETEQARQQLRKEIGDLAVLAAGKIVRKELDPRAQSQLIEQTLAEAGNRPAPETANGHGDRAAVQ